MLLGLCTSFGLHSADLCDAISCLARRLCTTYVDPKAFGACRLIALDKCPGVRVGDTLRHIIGKATSIILKADIQDAVMKADVRLQYMQ